jgi:orotidine-5'-phosphate decarboxylase
LEDAVRRGSILNRVAVALDTSDWEEFISWTELFGPRVGFLKIGLEAFLSFGPRVVEEARSRAGGLFLDLKLHDIPNTVAKAVAAARRQGIDYLTVHAAGGPAMLRAAAETAEDQVSLLAVTLLTHLDERTLERLELSGPGSRRALRWAVLAREAGCAGAVCSPQEVAELRKALPRPFQLVTPGIRPGGRVGKDDQQRTATPEAAIAAGADLLVIGRPLTRSPDPLRALELLAEQMRTSGDGQGS